MNTPRAGYYLYTTADCYQDNRRCTTREEKLKKLTAIRAEMDCWIDPIGTRVDEGIKETLVILNALGLHTTSSCEGHLDIGRSRPYVQVEHPEAPVWQFVGQKEAYEKVAKKYGITVKAVRFAADAKAWSEANAATPQNEETREFLAWSEKNRPLLEKLRDLVKEFNAKRKTPRRHRLFVRVYPGNSAQLLAPGKDFPEKDREKLTAKESREFAQQLGRHQAEMDSFTEFLVKKYFEGH